VDDPSGIRRREKGLTCGHSHRPHWDDPSQTPRFDREFVPKTFRRYRLPPILEVKPGIPVQTLKVGLHETLSDYSRRHLGSVLPGGGVGVGLIKKRLRSAGAATITWIETDE
jgi:hypothetical protein